MPRYDFECTNCHTVFEALTPSTCTVMHCTTCPPFSENGEVREYAANRLLCKPAAIHIK